MNDPMMKQRAMAQALRAVQQRQGQVTPSVPAQPQQPQGGPPPGPQGMPQGGPPQMPGGTPPRQPPMGPM